MGKTIGNLFFQEIASIEVSVKPKIISIKPELIIRGSTAKKG